MTKFNKQLIVIPGVILVIGVLILVFLPQSSNSNDNINSTNPDSTIENRDSNGNSSTIELNTLTGNTDLRNGYSASLPEGWMIEGEFEDAINTVKFGSPAYIINFVQESAQNDVFSPVITIQTFTIDERLNAKDVTNLIQDDKIADKLEEGTNECIFTTNKYAAGELDTYAFKQDNTNLEFCNSVVTEIGIVETVVLKNINNQNTLIASLTVSTAEEYQALLSEFSDLINSISN
ncbi:hypothetical protein ACFL0L_04195 [Patescibacteria group bacterium]